MLRSARRARLEAWTSSFEAALRGWGLLERDAEVEDHDQDQPDEAITVG